MKNDQKGEVFKKTKEGKGRSQELAATVFTHVSVQTSCLLLYWNWVHIKARQDFSLKLTRSSSWGLQDLWAPACLLYKAGSKTLQILSKHLWNDLSTWLGIYLPKDGMMDPAQQMHWNPNSVFWNCYWLCGACERIIVQFISDFSVRAG